MNEPLGYSRDGDVVTLRMRHEDFQNLLFQLGIAAGSADAREFEVLPLVNRICEGHPDFTPYKIGPRGRCARCGVPINDVAGHCDDCKMDAAGVAAEGRA